MIFPRRHSPPAPRAAGRHRASGWRRACTSLALGGLACGLGGGAGAAEADLRSVLNVFAGEWAGEMQVHAPDGFLLKTFAVERTSRWEGGELVDVTRYLAGDQPYEFRVRKSVRLGRLHAVVQRPGLPAEEFSGAIAGDAIAWTNASRNGRDFSETLQGTAADARLVVEGTEIMRAAGISGVVRVHVDYRPRPGGLLATARAAPPDERAAALTSELAGVRASAAAAAEAATQRQRELEAIVAEVRGQLEQARQLRDETLARLRQVQDELIAIRTERDRLTRANVSLQAELRSLREDAAAAVSVEPAATATASPGRTSAADEAAAAGSLPAAPPTIDIEARLAAFEVLGITHTDSEDKVILDGRPYRSGNVVDAALGLVFQRIDGDALVFTDADGREHRRRL